VTTSFAAPYLGAAPGEVFYWRLDPFYIGLQNYATANDFTGPTSGTVTLNNNTGTFSMTVKDNFPSAFGVSAAIQVNKFPAFNGLNGSITISLTKT
jgi:hypothetical protein